MSSDTFEAHRALSISMHTERFLVEGVGLLQASWLEAEGLAWIARVKTSLALTRARSRMALECAVGRDLRKDDPEDDGLEPRL